jgi:hypothetical protein
VLSRNNYGWTPLHTCCKIPIHQLIEEEERQLQRVQAHKKHNARQRIQLPADNPIGECSPINNAQSGITDASHAGSVGSHICNNYSKMLRLLLLNCPDINTRIIRNESGSSKKGSGLTPLDLAVQADNDIATRTLLYQSYQPHSSLNQCQVAVSPR